MIEDFDENDLEQIAVIGMAGRFPKAKSIDEFWRNLEQGKECITQFSEDELVARGVAEEEFSHSDYVRSGVVFEDIEQFDAGFFGYSVKEAQIMDPQQRVFLELAWEALDDAGCTPTNYDGSIGVFAGAGGNDYRDLINSNTNKVSSELDSFQAMLNNDSDYLATRISYKLNLKGPSFTLQTACSTSLVAIHVACQNLLTYQCDVAIAGGVSIRLPQGVGYRYREGMIWSPDGHCRAFDSKAQGVYLGHGAGVVILKRLSDAVADKDNIYAVVKGSAINNDGALKAGFTAPSVDGQADAIMLAQSMAGVSPESVSYVEAHGTGTLLGDPVEVEALTKAFRAETDKLNFCAIGSVKTNIGHLDAAAGVAGFIKTVLSLKYKKIPPSLNFSNPNPNIDFINSPFYVNSELSEWSEGNTPRRAGVSSFGIGGTNAHVILEEAPLVSTVINENLSRSCQVLMLSAKTEVGVNKASENLSKYLENHESLKLSDVAHTLHVGRQVFDYRKYIVCSDMQSAVDALNVCNDIYVQDTLSKESDIIFMFSGQGSQYVGMTIGLYNDEPIFQKYFDYCVQFLEPLIKLDLRKIIFTKQPEEIALSKEHLNQTAITQPALFVVEYCLAKLLESWGVTPKSMVGHSIGEYVAACLSGVFSIDVALQLVAQRGKMIQSLSPGAMMAVPLSEEALAPLLPLELSISVVNAPDMTVISGGEKDIKQFLDKLTRELDLKCQILNTSHAFHSQMMEPMMDDFLNVLSTFDFCPPKIPFVSNVTGKWITDDEAVSPEYWVRHLREPVQFLSCLDTLLTEDSNILIEVGPGQILTTIARQHPKSNESVILSATRRPIERKEDSYALLDMIGELWGSGGYIDWNTFYLQQDVNKVSLPSYPFDRQSYWYDKSITKNKELKKTVTISKDSHNQLKDDIEESVKHIFSNATGIPLSELNSSISFTDYGFDSLLLIQICSLLSDYFNIPILFRLLNETPNIDKLSQEIIRKLQLKEKIDAPINLSKGSINLKNLITIQSNGRKVPFIFVHGDTVNNFFPSMIDNEQPFYGYLHQGADGEKIKYKTVKNIATQYLKELKSIRPDGPYILGGFSFGGLVAYEMASQLITQGHDVRKVIMLDSASPDYLRKIYSLSSLRNIPRSIKIYLRDIKNFHMTATFAKMYLRFGYIIPSKLRTSYILSTYIRAASRYFASVLSCPVTLLHAEESEFSDASNGWIEFLGKNVSVIQVPGSHLSIVRTKKNFLVVAKHLIEQIRDAQRK